MTRIKICGIQTLEEALWAIEAGADALGFVFAPHSKRRITPQDAQKIILKLPPLINKVGVFVNESPEKIAAILQECYLDTIQLHGNEDPKLYHRLPAAKIKVLPFQPTLEVAPPTAFSSSLSQLKELPPHCLQGILLDSTHQGVTGGTGIPLPWQDERLQAYLRQVKSLGYPVILAGGLHPDNVREAIRLTLPYGVDVSSGVEEKGRKDRKKIQNFIGQVRRLRP